ncbi:hypothetical protein J2R91_001245 [Bradyrhizobium japonicum]|nr:hypothetical protein [Bradyrhizobium japonicum]
MQDNATPDLEANTLLADNQRAWLPPNTRTLKPKAPKFPPDEDINLWLKHNAPRSFEQLADIRYVLYHRCTRNSFAVGQVSGDQFSLIGPYSTLFVISETARRYLLWKLRLLGRKQQWISALPRTKNPRI